MEWFKVEKKIPDENMHVLIWRFDLRRYDVAIYVDHDRSTDGFNHGGPVWRFDSCRWSFIQPDDEWTHIPTRTDPITLGRSESAITIDYKFWTKVKDKKPPNLPKILLGWIEEGEFFYTVACIEPHMDDPETLMWTDCISHGLSSVLLTNHYWAEVPSIWPGIPAAILH